MKPTVTDADLILGYVPADNFLGGQMPLYPDLAREALRSVGEPLGLNAKEAASAIFRTVNAVMADEITEVCTKRGYDVRDFSLVVGGGAGPVHAAFLAEILDIQEVFIPSVAASYSALSMLSMDRGRDYARSFPSRLDNLDPQAVDQIYSELEQEAVEAFRRMGVMSERINMSRTAEMRYVGQFHEVEVPIDADSFTVETLNRAVEAFHGEHESLYEFSMPWMEVEFLTFRLKAATPQTAFSLSAISSGGSDPSHALRHSRTCIWGGDARETPVYDGRRLVAGNKIIGPAVVEERSTTIVVPDGFKCEVDELRNYMLTKSV